LTFPFLALPPFLLTSFPFPHLFPFSSLPLSVSSSDLKFDYPIHMPKAGVPLEPSSYINASVTELFFTNNEIHDLYYRYGFDEESGNFQEGNFGRGGLGGDAVQANAQDGSGCSSSFPFSRLFPFIFFPFPLLPS
jgi:hypothetical protein